MTASWTDQDALEHRDLLGEYDPHTDPKGEPMSEKRDDNYDAQLDGALEFVRALAGPDRVVHVAIHRISPEDYAAFPGKEIMSGKVKDQKQTVWKQLAANDKIEYYPGDIRVVVFRP